MSVITKTVYVTSDGKQWASEREAGDHDYKLKLERLKKAASAFNGVITSVGTRTCLSWYGTTVGSSGSTLTLVRTRSG